MSHSKLTPSRKRTHSEGHRHLSQRSSRVDSDEDEIVANVTAQVFPNSPLALYYQAGSVFKNTPGPSSRGPPFIEDVDYSEDLERAVIVKEIKRRTNARYQAEELTFQAYVNTDEIPESLKKTPLKALHRVVRQLIELLIRQCTRDLRPHDLIRFCLQAIDLDKPISTGIVQVSALSVEEVVGKIMNMLQSKDEITLESALTVDVITIRRDIGAGKTNKRVFNIDVDRMEKKSIVSVPLSDDGLCCSKAIVYAIAHLENDKRAINALKERRRPALLNRATKLHSDAGVPLGPCTYAEIAIFEEFLDLQIVVTSAETLNKVSYKGKDRPRRINLWLHNNHYDVIKSLKGFHGKNHYCENCEVSFQNIEDHRCENACYVCRRINCIKDQPVRCNDCDRECQSADCFAAHKAKSPRQKFSLCDKVYQCRQCCKVLLRRRCPMTLHRCGSVKCPSCKEYVIATEHECFLAPVRAKKPDDRLIFFDFETDQSSGEHLVNFAVAQYADGDKKVFAGYEACDEFCKWLFQPDHKGYTAIAHNMKGFDGQFIMAWMLKQGTPPAVIPNGSKVMAITHKSLNIRVIDSFNFLPMGLSKLPGCFGEVELKKGYFPHLFNSRENQKYIGRFPEAKYFNSDAMSSTARDEFLDWYKAQEGTIFNFQEEMLVYCSSDVDILRRCCLIFRNEFIEVTGVDPFCYVTIAAACMAVYRSTHLKANKIAMVPVHGYTTNIKYSPDAIRWLEFLSMKEDIFIQHALNGDGEQKIKGLYVDGYCAETKTVYQFHGCFYHGCDVCFHGDVANPLLGEKMSSLFEKTKKTTRTLRIHGYSVIEMWEHSFKQQVVKDTELKNFIATHEIQDRLKPRDAFYGGRTNAVKLLFKGRAKYVDFTSLYPYVNKYCLYPIGHPEVIMEDFGSLKDYFGIIKCKVLPPRGLYLPVLPYRCNGKLMFPLCRTCVEQMNQSPCEHKEDERAFIGTWVTEEVKKAVQKGYDLLKIYEVYDFKEKADDLFQSYIDLFLKIKQESSGYPTECKMDSEKQQYIENYFKKEHVQLESANIVKNPGRRQVAKLALNSFWGRWGMNINKTQLTYALSLPEFNKILADPSKNIKDIYLPTPEIAAIVWDSKKDLVKQDTVTNVFLAAFTTCWARLRLYSEMEKLGKAVLYHDTDSIIYETNGKNDPPLGNFLGEFTDELDGDVITEFVSGGPKNYAYNTEGGKTVCKVRGFTLNFRNTQVLNFDTVKELVCNLDKMKSISLNDPMKITRDGKRRKVHNKEERKLYRVVYDKRVIRQDLSTVPYGFLDDHEELENSSKERESNVTNENVNKI